MFIGQMYIPLDKVSIEIMCFFFHRFFYFSMVDDNSIYSEYVSLSGLCITDLFLYLVVFHFTHFLVPFDRNVNNIVQLYFFLPLRFACFSIVFKKS